MVAFRVRMQGSLCKRVLPDFKQDKSTKHAAGAAELLGVCAYLSGQPRTEWEKALESAYELSPRTPGTSSNGL